MIREFSQIGRACSKCGEFKVWGKFSPARKGPNGYSSWCRKCVSIKVKEVGYYHKVSKFRGVSEEKIQRNRANALARHYWRRKQVFEHYGEQCKRCGEVNKAKLQLDHVNDDGKKHRERDMIARNLSYWVVRNGFPEGFQILCRRCNLRKAFAKRRQERNA